MARANNGGWDFVKVGETYQYKEDYLIAMITILEDNSTDEEYCFKIRFEKANIDMGTDVEIDISHIKNLDGVYSGMLQIYEKEEYICEYKWINPPE